METHLEPGEVFTGDPDLLSQRRIVLADAHGHPGEAKAEADGISL